MHRSDYFTRGGGVPNNPINNMECKMIKKIGQNKTWNKADIPCINVTPNPNLMLQIVVLVNRKCHGTELTRFRSSSSSKISLIMSFRSSFFFTLELKMKIMGKLAIHWVSVVRIWEKYSLDIRLYVTEASIDQPTRNSKYTSTNWRNAWHP